MAHLKRNFYVLFRSFIALDRFQKNNCHKAHSHQVKAEAKAKAKRQTFSVLRHSRKFMQSDSSVQILRFVLAITQCIKVSVSSEDNLVNK